MFNLDKQEYSILFLFLFFIGLIYISWRSQYKEQDDDFIIGSRKVGFWGLFGSIISYMRAGSNLIFWFSFVAFMGFGSIWILVSFFTAFILMVFLAPKARRLSHENNYITFPDLIEDRQGTLMGHWITFFSFYGILVLTVSQLFVAGNVLGGLLGVSAIIGTVISSVIVAAYVVTGGFLSVVRTDIYQAAIIVLIATIAFLFADWPSAPEIAEQVFKPNWDLIVGFGLIGLAVPASTDMWQRFFAVEKKETIFPASFTALLVDIFIVFGLILFIQNMLTLVSDMDPQNVFLSMFSQDIGNPLAVALFGTFIVSAILSTMDNQVFNCTSIFTKNVLRLNLSDDNDKFVSMLRLISLISLSLFTVMSLTITDFMQWIIDTYAFIGVITPFIFYGVLAKAGSDQFLAFGVLICSIVYWALHTNQYYTNMYWYALPYSVPLLFIFADIVLFKTFKKLA